MNDDIKSLPNGDFEVVPKKIANCIYKNEDCPVCPQITKDLKKQFKESYSKEFVYHKETNNVYYVKSEQSYSSYQPKCYCITLQSYISGDKLQSPQYDEVFDKNTLILAKLSNFQLEEIRYYKIAIEQLLIDLKKSKERLKND